MGQKDETAWEISFDRISMSIGQSWRNDFGTDGKWVISPTKAWWIHRIPRDGQPGQPWTKNSGSPKAVNLPTASLMQNVQIACVCIFIFIFGFLFIFIFIFIYVYKHIHIYIYVHIHVNFYVCIYIYTFIYTLLLGLMASAQSEPMNIYFGCRARVSYSFPLCYTHLE